jgi:hypothetical protein
MISSPAGYEPLDVEQEWNRLCEALSKLIERNMVTLDRLEQPTLMALRRRLRQTKYHILHFVGHGGFDSQTQDSVLVVEDQNGRARLVDGQSLSTLLSDQTTLRLAVLNACEGARATRTDPFAGTAQSLVQGSLPAAIAMQFEISDDAAITFASEFYQAIAEGFPIDSALTEARLAIFAQGNGLEWGTPVLYLRSPNGHIFDFENSVSSFGLSQPITLAAETPPSVFSQSHSLEQPARPEPDRSPATQEIEASAQASTPLANSQKNAPPSLDSLPPTAFLFLEAASPGSPEIHPSGESAYPKPDESLKLQEAEALTQTSIPPAKSQEVIPLDLGSLPSTALHTEAYPPEISQTYLPEEPNHSEPDESITLTPIPISSIDDRTHASSKNLTGIVLLSGITASVLISIYLNSNHESKANSALFIAVIILALGIIWIILRKAEAKAEAEEFSIAVDTPETEGEELVPADLPPISQTYPSMGSALEPDESPEIQETENLTQKSINGWNLLLSIAALALALAWATFDHADETDPAFWIAIIVLAFGFTWINLRKKEANAEAAIPADILEAWTKEFSPIDLPPTTDNIDINDDPEPT